MLVILGSLAERAGLYRFRRRWWASPPAYLMVLCCHPSAAMASAARPAIAAD
jgi:hypothetical protein